MSSIIEILSQDPDFTILISALKQTKLIEKLSKETSVTFFAPTNDAFEELEEDDCDLQSLFQDNEELARILQYHIVPGSISTEYMIKKNTEYLATLAGIELEIEADESSVYVNDAEIIQPDVKASNGLIHVIDTVLVPE